MDQLIIHADVTTEPIDVNQTRKAIEGRPEILVADLAMEAERI